MTGGSTNGAVPSIWNTRAQGAWRRHRNHDSGKAMQTARAAARVATTTDAVNEPRHAASVKTEPYQRIEKPTGGKTSVRCALTETPAITISGAAMNRATSP